MITNIGLFNCHARQWQFIFCNLLSRFDNVFIVLCVIAAPFKWDKLLYTVIGCHASNLFQLSIQYSTIFISVTSDYSTDLSSGGLIVINASNPRVNVSFSLMDDSVFETDETLFANLNFTFASHPRVILNPISVKVIILGDDGKSILSDCHLSQC